MIHRLCLGANDLNRAKAFYGPVLGVLGLRLLSRHDKSLDYRIDDDSPGLHPEDRADYYDAFVRDPDGNKIDEVRRAARREEAV